jgi:predicted ABC-class ATPase
VLGGVGDYFEVADTVIQMIKYQPHNVTAEAKKISNEFPAKRRQELQNAPNLVRDRLVYTESINPFNEY